MDLAALDWLAVLAAAAAGYALGFAWYAPPVFGQVWTDALGKTPEERGSPAKALAVTALTTLVTATALAMIVQAAGATGWLAGLGWGLVVGIGILAANALSDMLFRADDLAVVAVAGGYRVAMIALMGLVLGAW